MHRLLGIISGDNPASRRLHEHFGFQLQGRLHEVGRKFGAWIDTFYYQKIL